MYPEHLGSWRWQYWVGWTAVSSPSIGPSHGWTLGGAVGAGVWGEEFLAKLLGLRGRQGREAKEEDSGLERRRVREG